MSKMRVEIRAYLGKKVPGCISRHYSDPDIRGGQIIRVKIRVLSGLSTPRRAVRLGAALDAATPSGCRHRYVGISNAVLP
jgi:hypothetical protein